MEFLKVNKARITDNGMPVHLKGVNLGGWLMPEAYFMHSPGWGYRFFKESFTKNLGKRSFDEIEKAFRDNFITENDFKQIALMGFDHVRLPFHYGLVETKPFKYSTDGLRYLDNAIIWARKYGIRVILDMHAVPGAQNHEWHSDSDGTARFWKSKIYQRRALALWQLLAERYKDEPAVAGYDVLNETVWHDVSDLNKYYHAVIKAIRAVDPHHIIFLEGDRWAQVIETLDKFDDENLVLGIHFYEPIEFVFNLIPGQKYPLPGWDRAMMRSRLEGALKTAKQRNRALWCGEFGVHARGGVYGEDVWVKDILAEFKRMDIHWSYWTWKAVKHFMLPDGVNSYYPNAAWVNRLGPETGWNTWHRHWPTRKEEMIAAWRTESYTPNESIVKALWKE